MVSDSQHKYHCKICKIDLSLAYGYGGSNDILRRSETLGHKEKVKAMKRKLLQITYYWYGGAGYFCKRNLREKWPEKQKSIKNQRQPAKEIEVLQSQIRKL